MPTRSWQPHLLPGHSAQQLLGASHEPRLRGQQLLQLPGALGRLSKFWQWPGVPVISFFHNFSF